MTGWAPEFADLQRGIGCPMCEDGRPDDNSFGLRVMIGEYSDAYLQRAGFRRGYVIVIHRGDSHVAELTDLPEEGALGYLKEVMAVAAAVSRVFRPLKMNLMLLGNALPHLHSHVVPRYGDDDDAGGPPAYELGDPRPEDELDRDSQRLRDALAAS